ncbi:biotin carboxyl carrier protein [Chthonomonas calidirosea]|uniref:acetyl-CoA carboxylase biotin carboxyl carrier protein n=1 Tax=Chthonomonas calidirosea TaxID=454171 RepID=UPI0006DD4BA8|nr:biotin/lipoyl-containing protein [Chthonomonas calidirosea]CEK16000.1 biotin carboxyl carrier protein [Chthonomonas calidirosea]
MDFEELERLVDLIQQASVCEITLKRGDQRITIRRSLHPVFPQNQEMCLATSEDEMELAETSLSEESLRTETAYVKAPLVGIFTHVRPQVKVGTPVNEGQVIAQIEAMGIKNEVVAPIKGVVQEVFVEDMQPVEYDQELFLITSERP